MNRVLSIRPWKIGTPSSMHFADRKSTRLNSSHVESSYAGFCWKKQSPSSSSSASPTPSGSASGSPSGSPSSVPDKADITLSGQVEAGVEVNCLILRAGGKVYQLMGGDQNVIKAGNNVLFCGHAATADIYTLSLHDALPI